MRELLGDAATPGDAGHIDLAVSEFGNERGGKPSQRRWPVRKGRRRRAADPGHVEDDRSRIRERFKEGFRQLPIRANSVEQKQRRLIARTMPYRDLERLPADQDLPDLDFAWLEGGRNWSPRTVRSPIGAISAVGAVNQRRRSPGLSQERDGARCQAIPARQPLHRSAHAANRANRATSFPCVSRRRRETHPAQPD